jgi:hypothetical protein
VAGGHKNKAAIMRDPGRNAEDFEFKQKVNTGILKNVEQDSVKLGKKLPKITPG